MGAETRLPGGGQFYAGDEKHRRTPGEVVFDWLRARPSADGYRYPLNYRTLASIDGASIFKALAAIWGLWGLGWWLVHLQRDLAIISAPVSLVAGVILGVVNTALSVLIVSWYAAYRRSDDQLYHQLLSRGVVAEARELRQKCGERVAAGTANVVRPVFTKRANLIRAHAVAATTLAPQLAQLCDEAAKVRNVTPADEAFLGRGLAKQFKRAAAPAADQGIRAAEAVSRWQNGAHLEAYKARWAPPQPEAEDTDTPALTTKAPDATDCIETVTESTDVLACAHGPLDNLGGKKGKGVLAQDVATVFGSAFGVCIWVGIERPGLVIGPARSGKGVHIVIPDIIAAPGSVVTTSTRPDNYYATAVCRAARGPIFVFNLDGSKYRDDEGNWHYFDVPHNIKWSPLEGCENPAVAMRRAKTLVASSGLGGENAVWATAAQAIVQAFLHAAALKHLTIDDVYRWSQNPGNAETPLRLLRELAAPAGLLDGWDQALESLRGEDKKMLGNKWFGVQNAFAGLAVYEVRKALSHQPTDRGYFDTAEFIKQSGTVYMISAGSNGPDDAAGSVGGFYSLFLDHITEVAQKIGKTSPGGHLDPPLSLILDELANIHPWRAAPRIMSEGSGVGVKLEAFFQSRAQARNSYGADMEKVMWDNANPVLLGGLHDPDEISDFVKLVSQRETEQISTSYDTGIKGRKQVSKQTRAGVEIDELSRLPFGVAATLPPRTNLVVARMTPYWKGPHAECIAKSKQWHENHPGQILESAITQR
jgi:hypothetical protein